MTSYYFIENIKSKGIQWINNKLNRKITFTKPGSISYLFFGKQISEQSVRIRFGHFGEYICKELILSTNNFELMSCGIQNLNNIKKDIDLLFKDKNTKIIYYRELKGNIELDTEKIQATIEKCKYIKKYLIDNYPDYTVNYGILNWSVYNNDYLTSGLSNIRALNKGDIQVDHMEDFFSILNIQWDENDFYRYFRKLGKLIKKLIILNN
jgi:hypothetical protein